MVYKIADTKISLLTEVTNPDNSDVLPIVNAGATKKVTVSNLAIVKSVNTKTGIVVLNAADILSTDQINSLWGTNNGVDIFRSTGLVGVGVDPSISGSTFQVHKQYPGGAIADFHAGYVGASAGVSFIMNDPLDEVGASFYINSNNPVSPAIYIDNNGGGLGLQVVGDSNFINKLSIGGIFNPTHTLDVNGDIKSNSEILVNYYDSYPSQVRLEQLQAGEAAFDFNLDKNDVIDDLTKDSWRLVMGHLSFGPDVSYFAIQHSLAGSWSPTTPFVIKQNDYVGIGTNDPQYALDVTGDVNITGDFRVNGTPISTGGVTRERKVGSDCSLTDGDVNRVLAVTGTPFMIAVDGTVLSETDDWTFLTGNVTFLVPIYDSQKIQMWRS